MQESQKSHGGPPTEFSMPMFRRFVPEAVRPWIYVFQAVCFQLTNGVYLGAMSERVGEYAVMREDVQMCLYATLAGMALYFPVLFRMKFRFSNKSLLMAAALTILAGNFLTLFNLPQPVLWVICFFCGVAKIQGTFENLSNIQLWMTPKRDMGVFFPLLHIILLLSMEFSAFFAAVFAFHYHWTLMHWFIMGLMLIVLCIQTFLCKPFHAMPKIVPLRGIDWFGALLWGLFALQVAYIFNYGDWLDWWNSPTVRLLTGTSIINFAVALHRMLTIDQPYYEPAMWRYRYALPVILLIGVVEALFASEHALEAVFFGSVMGYEDLTTEILSLWSLIGILAGCLFSLGWIKLMRWSPYRLIAVGLIVFVLYAGSLYFLVDANINIELMRLPIVFRGFAYAVLSIAFMWSLSAIMSFQHFFQGLSVFNILHMFIGGVIGGAFYAYGLKYYVADGMARYGGAVNDVAFTADPFDMGGFMENFVQGLLGQSVKTLYGWTLYAAIFFALLMLLWDIPGVRHRVKKLPLWPTVGAQLVNGLNRRQRLRRLRRERRNRAALS